MKYRFNWKFKKANVFGQGAPSAKSDHTMTGKVFVTPLLEVPDAASVSNVTFKPGARSFWHEHHAQEGQAQILICTAGEGWCQAQGESAISLSAGSVVEIPAGMVNWHGAKEDSWFSHVVVNPAGSEAKTEFLRPVTESVYSACRPLDAPIQAPSGNAFERANVFGKGVPIVKCARYFSGKSFLNPLTKRTAGKPFVTNTTFEPGCHTHWHAHNAPEGGGHILLCTAGEGWYQEAGKSVQALKPGSCVYVAPGTKHWHGATRKSWFSHLIIDLASTQTTNAWIAEVTEEEYPA